MAWHRFALGFTVVAGLAGLVGGGVATRATWLPWVAEWFAPPPPPETTSPMKVAVGENQTVRLSPQAQASLRLVVAPLRLETYWRTLALPGEIVDRPGESDCGMVAPTAGVVAKVHAVPGDLVRPGATLFTIRLLSETSLQAQSDLFKTGQEIQIVTAQRNRLAAAASSGGVSESRLMELDNQLRRLGVAVKAYRQELHMRGFTSAQIDAIAEGTYTTELQVTAPAAVDHETDSWFEFQELKVELGQQVAAGQTLGTLARHEKLYALGHGFRQDMPWVLRSYREGWPVEIDFLEDDPGDWPTPDQVYTIRHVANTIDPATGTYQVVVPLTNQGRRFERDHRPHLVWRFRPGQRVRLNLRVERFDGVFVLPQAAVLREGPEAFVFRQNGDAFDRKPVHVVFQDARNVILANDGSVPAGVYVVRNAAAQLNRALKSDTGLPAGFHMHADGSIHANH